jgi:DNA end-binding protein Ku
VTPNFDTNSWSAKAAVVSEPDSSGITNRLTSDEFQPENYEDEYRIRVLGMLDEKAKGRDIVIGAAPAPKRGQVIDIMEALKRSMERVPAKKKLAAAAVTKKKKKTS